MVDCNESLVTSREGEIPGRSGVKVGARTPAANYASAVKRKILRKRYSVENLLRSKGIAEAIEAERAGPTREVNVLPTEEEKLDGLDLEPLGLKSGSEMQEIVMSEEEGDIRKLEKSS